LNKPCIKPGLFLAALLLTLAFMPQFSALGADVLNWNINQSRVSADIQDAQLLTVLERIATVTRWQVFVEPETFHTVSAKFKDLPPGEALHLLLGDVSFALLPATNSSPKLFVFRTDRQNATQLVSPAKARESASAGKPIPNELIVRLKPGAKIDDLAKSIGAKVVGRIDSLNAYRLQFDDASATTAARDQLATNSDVASVDSNYAIQPPECP